MSYDSLYFALFLAVTWAAFAVLPWRGYVLLAASIAFYAVAGARDSLLAAAVILVNYAFQFPIMRDRRWLYAALVVDFGCLAYFKYRVFLETAAGFDVFSQHLVIPLGISFYIFQLTAFLIDQSRGRAKPFYSLPRFALFKLFFGQLVAGPIMRWRQFGPQIHRLFDGTLPRRRLLGIGLGLCLLGLIKKVVFADALAPFVETIFHNGPASAAAAWLGVFMFSSQVYFDFSGYSDIALGLGYLFGLRLAVNFRQPFTALTPQDFWRRWHVTLSFWIRDYLFTPLARLRRSRRWADIALIIAMALAGLWHGANWTFIVWGVGWALAILIWHMADRHLARLGVAQWVLTFGIWLVLLAFFRASDIGAALKYIATMFGGGSAGLAPVPNDGAGGALIVLGCAGLLALHWSEGYLNTRRTVLLMRRFDGPLLRAFFAGLALWLLMLPKVQDNPFIYFRF
ncbi:MAG TPA: MBOAT family O-acyltransferase [Xanthobacteraceae bacterium]|nr:MBOAT family O-acyltransferase [Xanthobacteraceae bacterium]